jgi:hypothetical protein
MAPRLSPAALAAVKAGALKRVTSANEKARVAGVRRSGIKEAADLNPPRGVIR